MENVIVESYGGDKHLFEDARFHVDDKDILHIISASGVNAGWDIGVFQEWTCAYRTIGAQDVADGGDK